MMLICASVAACAKTGDSDRLGVQLPSDCEQLARSVDGPEWQKGQHAKILLGQTTVALEQANANLDKTRVCQIAQRETFGNPASTGEK